MTANGAAPPATMLSLVALTCAVVASLTTLAWSGAFPSPPGVVGFNAALAEARGWSAVTLALVAPALVAAVRSAARGLLVARLAWLGLLVYLVYTYLELAVSPPFTALSLVYVVAFACAVPASILVAASLDPAAVARALGEKAPRRATIAFALASSVLLALAWLKGIVVRMLSGDFGWPTGVEAIGHVVHALDLGLLVPLGLASALLLIRRRPAGYIVGVAMLVNSTCMGFALTAMVLASAVASGQALVAAAPFAALPCVAGALVVGFFRAARG